MAPVGKKAKSSSARNNFLSYSFFYKKLEQLALQMFPGLAALSAQPGWDHLISPLELKLPRTVLENASAAIRALHAISRREAFARALEPVAGISDVAATHESVLMAYDFHTNEAGECFLVEVNTNASGFLLASLMDMIHTQATVGSFAPLEMLAKSFARELELWGKAGAAPVVAITDEEILQQKMYPEFVMYRDWFRSFGWKAEFCESRDFAFGDGRLSGAGFDKIDLVYNRLTDFYLENPAHAALRAAFGAQAACVTPSPREYWLLADKQRLVELGREGFLAQVAASAEEAAAVKKVLLPTFDKKSFPNEDEIWSQRKNLFFKPKRSHGGKSVYRGESVSRKVFERLMAEDVLIQHFQPAQKVPTDDPRSVLSHWKFDLRFFVYADQIQLAAARIYQGQVTNFSSPLGGFTRVNF